MLLKADVSYSLISTSDVVRNAVIEYLYFLNDKVGVKRVRSLVGKYIVVSDTELPTKKKVVFSSVKRGEDFTLIKIDNNLVEICFEMNGLDVETYLSEIKYIKKQLKSIRDIEVAYFTILSLFGMKEINEASIDKAFSNKNKRVTTSELLDKLINFINNPDEISLMKLTALVTEDYQRLINLVALLMKETPAWITEKYGDLLNDTGFIKNLMKITLITIKAKTINEFIVYSLNDVIYS